MPQSRPRRVSVAAAGGDSRSQPRPTGTKPSCKIANEPQRDSSKFPAKIPKSVRFDLEKALVGLCNVWFEDIKPHLLRNNIKLHVHGDAEDSGDASTVEEPPAQACSHLDPEYECFQCQQRRDVCSADYCTTLQRALNERSHKQPPQHPPHHRLLSVLHSQPTPTNQPPICKSPEDPVQARARRKLSPSGAHAPRKLSPSGAHAPRQWRMTYLSPPFAAVPEYPLRTQPLRAQPLPPQALMKLLLPTINRKPVRLKKKRRPNVNHKATQTDEIPLVPPLRNLNRWEGNRSRHNPKPKPGLGPRPNLELRRNMEHHAKQTESDPLIENDNIDLEKEANHHYLRLICKKSETKAEPSMADIYGPSTEQRIRSPSLNKHKSSPKRALWR